MSRLTVRNEAAEFFFELTLKSEITLSLCMQIDCNGINIYVYIENIRLNYRLSDEY